MDSGRGGSYRARVKSTLLATLLLALVAVPVSAAEQLVIPTAYDCPRATGPISIDGKADEPAWAKAVVIESFVAFWANRPAKTKTKARLLWDDDYLYFHAEMEDADLYADERQTNGRIWENDVFELFLRPDSDKTGYYEFQVSAGGAQFDAFYPSYDLDTLVKHAKAGKFRIETWPFKKGENRVLLAMPQGVAHGYRVP